MDIQQLLAAQNQGDQALPLGGIPPPTPLSGLPMGEQGMGLSGGGGGAVSRGGMPTGGGGGGGLDPLQLLSMLGGAQAGAGTGESLLTGIGGGALGQPGFGGGIGQPGQAQFGAGGQINQNQQPSTTGFGLGDIKSLYSYLQLANRFRSLFGGSGGGQDLFTPAFGQSFLDPQTGGLSASALSTLTGTANPTPAQIAAMQAVFGGDQGYTLGNFAKAFGAENADLLGTGASGAGAGFSLAGMGGGGSPLFDKLGSLAKLYNTYAPFLSLASGIAEHNPSTIAQGMGSLGGAIAGSQIAATGAVGGTALSSLGAMGPWIGTGIGALLALVPALSMYFGGQRNAAIERGYQKQAKESWNALTSSPDFLSLPQNLARYRAGDASALPSVLNVLRQGLVTGRDISQPAGGVTYPTDQLTAAIYRMLQGTPGYDQAIRAVAETGGWTPGGYNVMRTGANTLGFSPQADPYAYLANMAPNVRPPTLPAGYQIPGPPPPDTSGAGFRGYTPPQGFDPWAPYRQGNPYSGPVTWPVPGTRGGGLMDFLSQFPQAAFPPRGPVGMARQPASGIPPSLMALMGRGAGGSADPEEILRLLRGRATGAA